MTGERLHKVLAQRGLGSRREIEQWIVEGRVRLNGKPAQLGDRYNPGDRLAVDGKDVTARIQGGSVGAQVLIYHKAQGQLLVRRPSNREEAPEPRTGREDHEPVRARLPAVRGSRWLAINPMQAGDAGLLLFTNDGRLANALNRHAAQIPTAYAVRVLAGSREDDAAPELPLQVQYDDETIEFTQVSATGGEGANRWYDVELARADRRAAVRALFESQRLAVSRAVQTRFANIELPRDLPRGRHRLLDAKQMSDLYSLVGLPMPAVERSNGRARRAPREERPAPSKASTNTSTRGRGKDSAERAPRRGRVTGSRKSGR
jgi:23S rRNA pseudouridine2605 synthase